MTRARLLVGPVPPAAPLAPDVPPAPALAASAPRVADDDRAARAAAVVAMNATHAMAGMRARAGRVVAAVEARRRAWVASRVRRLRPRVVVDVGCEDGWIASAYADRAGTTVLVDLDPAMLARADARGLPRTRCVVGDALGPACLPDGCADVLVLSAVLEHVAAPERVLLAWRRVLVAGGHVVVMVPADGPILSIKRLLRATGLGRLLPGLSLDPAPGHVVTFRRATLARLLRRFGAVEELGFDPRVLGYVAVLRVGGDDARPGRDERHPEHGAR